MDNQPADERTRDNIEQLEAVEGGDAADTGLPVGPGLGFGSGGPAVGGTGLTPGASGSGLGGGALFGGVEDGDRGTEESDYDDTVDDSFPASDPPASGIVS